MSKHRVLRFQPQLRLERRAQHGHNETEQPDHAASLGDSVTSSTRIEFSVHTGSEAARNHLYDAERYRSISVLDEVSDYRHGAFRCIGDRRHDVAVSPVARIPDRFS